MRGCAAFEQSQDSQKNGDRERGTEHSLDLIDHA
jgi:hypothetical protein